MKKIIALAAGAVLAAGLSSPVLAQGAPQTIASVNVHTLATGYRASNIIGSKVVNDANENVVTAADLIVSRDTHGLYAVVSVGGFLGVGKHLIAIPYAELRPMADNRGLMLPGATKDSLKRLPEYKYAS